MVSDRRSHGRCRRDGTGTRALRAATAVIAAAAEDACARIEEPAEGIGGGVGDRETGRKPGRIGIGGTPELGVDVVAVTTLGFGTVAVKNGIDGIEQVPEHHHGRSRDGPRLVRRLLATGIVSIGLKEMMIAGISHRRRSGGMHVDAGRGRTGVAKPADGPGGRFVYRLVVEVRIGGCVTRRRCPHRILFVAADIASGSNVVLLVLVVIILVILINVGRGREIRKSSVV
mmetsp:Transcript_12971/g.36537  ORF Transcript_12971/g.36537 Transcript_12971/m.36537 type:complete len:229 (+) Transcript_12971:537-1223(+)